VLTPSISNTSAPIFLCALSLSKMDIPNTPGVCSYLQAQVGDTCLSLSQGCNITLYQLTQDNPVLNCDAIQVNQYVCCSAGYLPDFSPKPYSNGTCYTYTVQPGDSCSSIAQANQISSEDTINNVNSQTWGWSGCANLLASQTICLSDGIPPFPSSIQNAECGPQVSSP
jgi:chitinase